MYRIDRHDAMSDVPADAPIGEQLAYCSNHLIRVNRREGTFEVAPNGSPVLSAVDVASSESGILLGEGWFSPNNSDLWDASVGRRRARSYYWQLSIRPRLWWWTLSRGPRPADIP